MNIFVGSWRLDKDGIYKVLVDGKEEAKDYSR